jgi:hypothetical protein
MVLDATSISESSTVVSSSDEDDEEEGPEGTGACAVAGSVQSSLGKDRKIERGLHTGHLLKMVLQDAQTRLFFKAQAVVQSEIRHYTPTPDDLKWPDILLGS